MVIVTLGGKLIAYDFKTMGVENYFRTYGVGGMVSLILFGVCFPLGAAFAMIGVLLISSATKARTWAFILVIIAALIVTPVTSIIFGAGTSPAFFGISGSLILILFAALIWYWGINRTGVLGIYRTALDLQMIGYFCFVMAAWFLCGVGGPPAYVLYPNKMIDFNTLPMAIIIMKIVMIYFILGWIFTLASFYKKAKTIPDKT